MSLLQATDQFKRKECKAMDLLQFKKISDNVNSAQIKLYHARNRLSELSDTVGNPHVEALRALRCDIKVLQDFASIGLDYVREVRKVLKQVESDIDTVTAVERDIEKAPYV